MPKKIIKGHRVELLNDKKLVNIDTTIMQDKIVNGVGRMITHDKMREIAADVDVVMSEAAYEKLGTGIGRVAARDKMREISEDIDKIQDDKGW